MVDSSQQPPEAGRNLPPLEDLVRKTWVDLKGLAALLEVTYRVALRYIKLGQVKARRHAGTWRIDEEEVRRYLTYGPRPTDLTLNKKADDHAEP